jgi:phosphate-selective porin OprO/OprP
VAYRTPGQLVLFRYRADGTDAGTALADGLRTRLAPQGYYHAGPLRVLGEYAISSQRVRMGDDAAVLENRAWSLSAGLLATGGGTTYGPAKPRRDSDSAARTRGSLELVGRVQALRVDDAAFPVYADPARSPRAAHAWGAGVNWYLNRCIRLSADYQRTRFRGGAATGDRAPENTVLSRIQVAF